MHDPGRRVQGRRFLIAGFHRRLRKKVAAAGTHYLYFGRKTSSIYRAASAGPPFSAKHGSPLISMLIINISERTVHALRDGEHTGARRLWSRRRTQSRSAPLS